MLKVEMYKDGITIFAAESLVFLPILTVTSPVFGES